MTKRNAQQRLIAKTVALENTMIKLERLIANFVVMESTAIELDKRASPHAKYAVLKALVHHLTEPIVSHLLIVVKDITTYRRFGMTANVGQHTALRQQASIALQLIVYAPKEKHRVEVMRAHLIAATAKLKQTVANAPSASPTFTRAAAFPAQSQTLAW